MLRSALKPVMIGAALFMGLAQAQAGVASDRAKAHFQAIAARDAKAIASSYTDNAIFHWVGGPLTGVYVGKQEIQDVWKRFGEAAGDINYTLLQISEADTADGSKVNATVRFSGAGVANVNFTMLYRNGRIASEVWEVDKSRGTGTSQSQPDERNAERLRTAQVEPQPNTSTDAAPEQPKLVDFKPDAPPPYAPKQESSRKSLPEEPASPEAEEAPETPGQLTRAEPKPPYGYERKNGYDTSYIYGSRPTSYRGYEPRGYEPKYYGDHCNHNAGY